MVGNQYRSGVDHIGFHHDKTRDFVDGSSVLTVSFGQARRFQLRRVSDKKKKIELVLEHGSVFVLGPKTNQEWKHSIVKQSGKKIKLEPRVSLTFRSIKRRINQETGEIVSEED